MIVQHAKQVDAQVMPLEHRYVLVTPARNESAFIRKTIESVTGQTILPREWVIVSDGSTDGTDEIVTTAAEEHPWIRLLRLPPRERPSFAAVVENTETGLRALQEWDYAFIGLLDADVSFQQDYFEQLLDRFQQDPELGLAGGVVIDVGVRSEFRRNEIDVAGAVQFFRRACFESLGGLLAIPEGGWDAVTCVAARMNGYGTATIDELLVDHHKPRNCSHGGWIRRTWQLGQRDYVLGYDPLFEIVKCVRRALDPPVAVGSLARWFGYCVSALKRRSRRIPPPVVKQIRMEQRQRLLRLVGLSRS